MLYFFICWIKVAHRNARLTFWAAPIQITRTAKAICKMHVSFASVRLAAAEERSEMSSIDYQFYWSINSSRWSAQLGSIPHCVDSDTDHIFNQVRNLKIRKNPPFSSFLHFSIFFISIRIHFLMIYPNFIFRLFGLIDSQRMNFDKNAIIPALLPNKESLQLQLGQLGLETFEFELIANFLFERKPICLVLDE